MLIVRLKQCEHALDAARLDEAFNLARAADFRAHRRGQELVGKLIAALVERGRSHLAAGRLEQASADCDKAAFLGGNLADVAQLRAAVNTATHGRDQVNRGVGQVLANARRHADQGQLTVGQQILNAAPPQDLRVEGLKNDLIARRAVLESNIMKATAALDSGDWEAAIDFLAPLRGAHVLDGDLRQICGKIADHVSTQITAAFEAGRLNLAAALLTGLDRLPIKSVNLDHLHHTLDQCRMAANAIESNQPADAKAILQRLGALWPNAAWIAPAEEQTSKLHDALAAVRGSPLSLLSATTDTTPHQTPRISAPPAQPLNTSFCIHVDGVGSFLILTGSTITLGPTGASRSVDLALMMDAAIPTVTIARCDEDYFLKANAPVSVNDTPRVNILLNTNDRIALGSRCRILFRRPSPASTSAVLDLSGTRLAASTIRQVILMDRELIIGPGSTAHIRADDLVAPVVLQIRNNSLFCRSAADIAIDGRPAGRSTPIAPGGHITVGSLGFVVVTGKEQHP